MINLCQVTFPLGFSPAAMHQLAHEDGEIGTSKAAAKHNICMALSAYATHSIEDVKAQGNGNPYVMQLCVLQNKELTKRVVQRAEGRLDREQEMYMNED